MACKYLVVELKDETSLESLLSAISNLTKRFAVVNEVPGIFSDVAAIKEANNEQFENSEQGQNNTSSMDTDGYLSQKKARPTKKENPTVLCQLCRSIMTIRKGYGKVRLRDHVLRHLNTPLFKCGYCDYEGALKDHIRHHNRKSHPGMKCSISNISIEADFDEKFNCLWEQCFPGFQQSNPRKKREKIVEQENDGLHEDETNAIDHKMNNQYEVVKKMEYEFEDDDFQDANNEHGN